MSETASGDQIRAAQVAHRRLLQGGDAEPYIRRTSYRALRDLAERTDTLNVPQIRDALRELQTRD